MSSQIAGERKDYYRELERAQRGQLDITGWLEWFLGCLGRALEGAEGALGAVLNKAKLWERINRRPVNERQRLVINRLLNGFKGHLTTSKYAKLAKCSTDTHCGIFRNSWSGGFFCRMPAAGGVRAIGWEMREQMNRRPGEQENTETKER